MFLQRNELAQEIVVMWPEVTKTRKYFVFAGGCQLMLEAAYVDLDHFSKQ